MFLKTAALKVARGNFQSKFVKHLRWRFFVNIMNGLKPLIIFTKKLHLRCFLRFCVCLCSEVTSSIYQKYNFKVYCKSFWGRCIVFDVVFSRIKETLCPLSNLRSSKNLELLCDFMFATHTKTVSHSINSINQNNQSRK